MIMMVMMIRMVVVMVVMTVMMMAMMMVITMMVATGGSTVISGAWPRVSCSMETMAFITSLSPYLALRVRCQTPGLSSLNKVNYIVLLPQGKKLGVIILLCFFKTLGRINRWGVET